MKTECTLKTGEFCAWPLGISYEGMRIWIWTSLAATLLLGGVSTAWAVCPDGKSEVVLYTADGNANMLCVSDNALPGIENANTHTVLDVCEEVPCSCWDAETLENLPPIPLQPADHPLCYEDYRFISFHSEDEGPGEDGFNSDLLIWDEADYYGGDRRCAISSYASWVDSNVQVVNLSPAETNACAEILRASKWWNMCSAVGH